MQIYGAGRVWNLGDGYTLGDGMLFGQLVYNPSFEPPSVPLLRQTVQRVRQPWFAMFIEGVGTVSENIKNAHYKRVIKDSLKEPIPASGRVTILDTEGEYIENGRSTIEVNAKVKLWTGFGGDLTPRFTGVVYDPKVNTEDNTVNIGIADYGRVMKKAFTSGDWSEYATPKDLITELMARLYLGEPEFENEDGLPSTFTFGNTTLSQRNYWAIAQDALICIGYVGYFDMNGRFQCRRRDGFTDTDLYFDDSMIKRPGIRHQQMGEIINSKSLSHSPENPPWTDFALGESVRWGQTNMTITDRESKARYSEHTDYSSNEFLSGWSNVFPVVRDSVDWYKSPRHIYEMDIPARPQLDIMDRIRVRSEQKNIAGYFLVIGVEENISPANYWQRVLLLSDKETD